MAFYFFFNLFFILGHSWQSSEALLAWAQGSLSVDRMEPICARLNSCFLHVNYALQSVEISLATCDILCCVYLCVCVCVWLNHAQLCSGTLSGVCGTIWFCKFNLGWPHARKVPYLLLSLQPLYRNNLFAVLKKGNHRGAE